MSEAVTKTCRTCPSTELVKRGQGVRPYCRECWAAQQRIYYARKDRTLRQASRRSLYVKHAVKRRAEASAHKAANKDYYALAEWFRKKGVKVSDIDSADMAALVDMRKALKESKAQTEAS